MEKEQLAILKKLSQLNCLQTKAAILDSELHMDRLSQAFTDLISLEEAITQNLDNQHMLADLTQSLRKVISQTTIELQFFDRLKQKLEHACKPMSQWANQGKLLDPESEEFSNQYSTPEELTLYEEFIKCGDVEKALANFQSKNIVTSSEPELF
ncbi:MAG TPA: hypothetical protein ENJ60_08800 [Aeromonadales bacterium]|nr:hypothetical protein [Aeromonadales bacterium]